MEALDAEEKRWRERHCDVKVLWDFENINFANNHLPTDDGQAGEYLNNLENWILCVPLSMPPPRRARQHAI